MGGLTEAPQRVHMIYGRRCGRMMFAGRGRGLKLYKLRYNEVGKFLCKRKKKQFTIMIRETQFFFFFKTL